MDRPVIEMNDLARSWVATRLEVREAVDRVLQSGRYLLGSETLAFEAELAAFVGVDHAIATASGTDALALAMLAVDAGPGTEVVLAANAGGYGSVAAAQIGAQAVYADVDPGTACLSPRSVEEAIGPRTRAVLVTHLYGNVADIQTIVATCRTRGIAVIEDCAQAMGGEVGGRRVGSIGDIAAFSFYPTKNLGAPGDAGAVVTNDQARADRVRALRQYGWSERYRIAMPGGRNSRMDELHAAALRIGLGLVEERNTRRRAILDRYRQSTPRLRWITGATETVAHLAVLRMADRVAFRAHMRDAGIATDVHYPIADHRQPALPVVVRTAPLHVTEELVSEVVSVPCHPDLDDEEVDRVAAALEEAQA